ncbi:MAG: hypothetical protein ABS36_06195 [Acidobacteria bacterium SCN 69-37]|nr:MAG: hypothetical protein ABS36_06195 [Acidobacteria bacterium SCN 69-37]
MRFRLVAMLRRTTLDRDLGDELEHHLAMRAECEMADGIGAHEARRRAVLRFGNISRFRDEAREARRFVWLAEFAADVHHGARLSVRQPLFSSLAIVILALGIGLNVAIFGAMSALLYRPVPGLSDADRLVAIGRTENGAGFELLSYPDAADLRERNSVLTGLATYSDVTVALDSGEATTRARGQLASANFFDVLIAGMTRGRGFSDGADRAGVREAVVSEGFWTRALGSRPDVIGSRIRVNGESFDIVGVAPLGFQGVVAGSSIDVWVPLRSLSMAGPSDAPFASRSANWLSAVGRLRPDVSRAEARVALGDLGRALAREFPADNEARGIAVESVAGLGPSSRESVLRQWVLLNGLASLVLLVVCFNVVNMTLSRAAARTQEMRIRLSLGAGRLRLVRQLLAEHVMLAVVGGVGGALIAFWGSAALLSAVPATIRPGFTEPTSPDWRVFAFTVALALGAGIVCAVPPALTASRTRAARLVQFASGPSLPPRTRLRSVCAILQVAVSLALLIGAGLLARSLQQANEVNLGFDPDGIVTAYYDLDVADYTADTGAALHGRLLESARHWSGVQDAALGLHVPLQGSSLGMPIEIPSGGTDDGRMQLVRMNIISPGFFRTLGTPLLRGREFGDDDAGGPQVAVVNETCRRVCFGGSDPIGRRIVVFRENAPREIVGVVADSKYSQPLEEVRPTVFVPVAQRYAPRLALLLRTSSAATVIGALPGNVRRVDPSLPLYDLQTLEDRLALALWQPRAISMLVGVLGTVSLVLAVLGVYAVVAETVVQRMPEFAVRMALGAGPATILWMVLRNGLSLVIAGTVLGAGLALATSGLLRSFLYRVEAIDATSFALAMFALAGAALGACLIPARRAARANPANVLRP